MATATINTKQIEIPQPVKYETRPDGVTLVLTDEEAFTIACILGAVGGHPERSRRKYAATVYAALGSIGFYSNLNDMHKEGMIRFTE